MSTFVRIIFLLGIFALVACNAPTATPTPMPLPTPTQVPTPTIAPTNTIVVSIPTATATNMPTVLSATNTPAPSPTKASATATVAAAHTIFASPNKTPITWAQLMVQNVKPANTSYKHKDNSVTWAGVNGAADYQSFADCSGFANALVAQTYGLAPDDFDKWLGARRPLAKDYFTAVSNKRGFNTITSITNVQVGDVIVIRYLNSAPGDNTGHILFIASAPQHRDATKPTVNNTLQWDVPIIDSSESGHGKEDTRHQADGSYRDGVGRGTMRLYTDTNGNLVGYTWSDLSDSIYYDANARPLVVGRFDPKFKLP